jgi:two-component system response regulator PilR (NtrC family)
MSSPRILVVDDEADLRELLELTLVKMGLDVDSAQDVATARAYLAKNEYALVLTDMRLPDGLGIELVEQINVHYKNTPVAVITAYGSAENAVMALKAGAFDYLSKPVGLEQLRVMVRSALRFNQNDGAQNDSGQNGAGQNDAAGTTTAGRQAAVSAGLRLLGQSAAIEALRVQIARLARSMAPVAISGESGSGKELAARDIHAQSGRSDKPFIAVNCGAIPETLMEAEFFGYRKGAFTGATDDRDGFFQAANGGTLLLDEVADLPLAMQVKLLRVIQERGVRKIGATQEEPIDVRIISATHQNLQDCVARGTFRQDLYYRLNVIELHLPPLRERLDDVALLAGTILARLATHGERAELTPAALDALRAYHFPGNVRELENILERALAFANDGLIAPNDLSLKPAARLPDGAGAVSDAPVLPESPPEQQAMPADALRQQLDELAATTAAAAPDVQLDGEADAPPDALPASLPDHMDDVEREIIRRALAKTHFNRTQAAELLGISFRQLRYRMQRLNIQAPE